MSCSLLDQSSRETILIQVSNRKYKIPDHQNGQVYLTSHRICYVDNDDPRRNSTAIDLKDVDRYEFYVRTDYAILGGGSEGVHN